MGRLPKKANKKQAEAHSFDVFLGVASWPKIPGALLADGQLPVLEPIAADEAEAIHFLKMETLRKTMNQSWTLEHLIVILMYFMDLYGFVWYQYYLMYGNYSIFDRLRHLFCSNGLACQATPEHARETRNLKRTPTVAPGLNCFGGAKQQHPKD